MQQLEEEKSPELFGWVCFHQGVPWLPSFRSLEHECMKFVFRETGVPGIDQAKFGYQVTKVALRKVDQ
jgi:hypothetical protein